MKKLISILLCISLILIPVLMTGCTENDKKDDKVSDSSADKPTDDPGDEPSDVPSGDPADTPTDEPTGGPTEGPDTPVEEPTKDDPKSYVKFTAGLADLFLRAKEITGDYREKILTGNEKIDSGKFNITANALSFAGNDYLSGNKYALDGIFAHGKTTGTIVSGTFKGKEETGLQLFVTPEGSVYVMIPSVDNAVYVKLFDLDSLPIGSDDASDGSNQIVFPDISGENMTEKLPESVKSITEEKVSVTVLGTKLDGVTKLTVTVDASTLEDFAASLPDSVGGLVANYFPEGLPENTEATITLFVKDGATVLAEAAVASTDSSFSLSLAVVGETGKENYGLTVISDDKDGTTKVDLTGKRENTDTLTKGSVDLKIESTKKETGTTDEGADDSDMISSLLGNGNTSVGFSYERKTTGNKTESLYKVKLGIDMGFTTMTLNIPLNAETVRGDNGSVTHTLSIDTVKANLPKELMNIQLSASFTLGEGLEGAGAVMPTFTDENTLDPSDPDDAEALAAYTEKFETQCKELADFIKNLIGSSEPEEPEESEAKGVIIGKFKSVNSTPVQTYEFTVDGKVSLSVNSDIGTITYEGSYILISDELTLIFTVEGNEIIQTYSFLGTGTGIIINGIEYIFVS